MKDPEDGNTGSSFEKAVSVRPATPLAAVRA
jgi:hypothetical protein